MACFLKYLISGRKERHNRRVLPCMLLELKFPSIAGFPMSVVFIGISCEPPWLNSPSMEIENYPTFKSSFFQNQSGKHAI